MATKEEHILLHAEQIIATQGYNGTSVRDIAAKAKVNISMISYYFGSKEKLMEALFKWRMDSGIHFAQEILENPDYSEVEKIELILYNYVNRVKKLKNFYLIMQTQQVISQNKIINDLLKNYRLRYIQLLQLLIESGQEKGIFKNNPNLFFIHTTLTGTLFNAINGMQLYKDFADDEVSKLSEAKFKDYYFENLFIHLKSLLKNLLGYENK
ncbi:TetR/AcrR family transcriptional regulator [Sphingobacterium hungaricum]|uniref:TetR/AcrR family transcriptional regulator n=1 Tax=Sphingobacterium hungaricum TaxID=2082723 RepID=A0A928YS88_9SPHI|nr:TetR/AcrR family transcriptional regulator [Sphingobacterium hungaricum]MBE8714990.1 TetR/AcrR family transcriptional regulator [Sphingobacterium hungaricum]